MKFKLRLDAHYFTEVEKEICEELGFSFTQPEPEFRMKDYPWTVVYHGWQVTDDFDDERDLRPTRDFDSIEDLQEFIKAHKGKAIISVPDEEEPMPVLVIRPEGHEW